MKTILDEYGDGILSAVTGTVMALLFVFILFYKNGPVAQLIGRFASFLH